MRGVAVALGLALIGGAAAAQGITGGGVPVPAPRPNVPSGVKVEAEDLVKRNVAANPANILFYNVQVDEAASVRHGFDDPIDGPVSVVCGQYQVKDRDGSSDGTAWFFVPIKDGKVLWSLQDDLRAAPGDAYYACRKSGLAE